MLFRSSNRPEQLVTRIEGGILNLGFDIPLTTKYSATYAKRAANTTSIGEPQTERGTLKGYSVFVNYTVFLGY